MVAGVQVFNGSGVVVLDTDYFTPKFWQYIYIGPGFNGYISVPGLDPTKHFIICDAVANAQDGLVSYEIQYNQIAINSAQPVGLNLKVWIR